MKGKLSSITETFIVATLIAAAHAWPNPAGAAVPESPPLSCQTANFTVQVLMGGGFPKPTQCVNGQACLDYGYSISSTTLNVDHTVFAVSASQDLDSVTPSNVAVALPGVGDTVTGFLVNAKHEYAVRFNSSGTKAVEVHMIIKGASKPRIGSILMRSWLNT